MAQDENLVKTVTNGVKSGFVTVVTTALVSALVSALVAVWAAIQFVPNYVGLVPAGIVAAYWTSADLDSRSSHCPAGWSPVEEARGRFIVAAGTPFHSVHKEWAPGRILDTREPLVLVRSVGRTDAVLVGLGHEVDVAALVPGEGT